MASRSSADIERSLKRLEARHEALWTASLDEMNAIENDPCFTCTQPRGLWVDRSAEAEARRGVLHDRYRAMCDQREAELRAKYGEWPLPPGALRDLARRWRD